MWISLSRQQSRRSSLMPSAAHSSIPPPGPPARPGVLKFHPPSAATTDAVHSTAVSSVADTTVHCFSPACLGNTGVTVASPATSTNTVEGANIAGRCNAGGDGGGHSGWCYAPNRAVTPETLEVLPIPPPSKFKRFTSFITGSKKGRRKSDDKKQKSKEKPHGSSSTRKETERTQPSAPQLPEEFNENYGLPSVGAKTAWGSPGQQSPVRVINESGGEGGGGPWNRSGPTRKSFRFGGHVPDLSAERNMLPLWLEEETREGIRPNGRNFINKNEAAVIHDNSFDSRWNSMKGRNKKRPSIPSVRPPGWEDVDQQGKRKKKTTGKAKSNFCPSFTINDLPKDNLQQDTSSTSIQPISPPIRVHIEPPSESDRETTINNHPYQRDAFDMAELTANVNNIFSDSFPQGQTYSNSTSHLEPRTTSASPTRTLSQASTSAIADRHLWASTDSFICEDFSFCSGRQPRDAQQEHIPPPQHPRSYSEVILNHPESDRQEFTDHDGMYTDREEHLQNHFSCISTPEQEDFEAHLQSANENKTEIRASCQSYTENAVNDNTDILDSLYDHAPSHESMNHLEPSNPTIRMMDNLPRQHWIRFDNGSFRNLDEVSTDTYDNSIDDAFPHDGSSCDSEHQSNFEKYRKNSEESSTSPTSPILPRNNSGSTLNLVEPRLEQTSASYKGQLVRSYSQRGRRASKRVAKTVTRKMNPSEYGKLTEPVQPMYSKAVLTMTSGPGLFEQNNTPAVRMVDDDMNAQIEERQKEARELEASTSAATQSKSTKEDESSLSPSLPKRVGSLRVPRLPTIFLRRSVSLNAPKVSQGEVPFQRLTERRGSFRKAISGLSVIARNFRRRSDGLQTSTSSSSHAAERASGGGDPPPRLQRSGSIGSSFSKQMPKAPRLPRRAISHKHVTANDT